LTSAASDKAWRVDASSSSSRAARATAGTLALRDLAALSTPRCRESAITAGSVRMSAIPILLS